MTHFIYTKEGAADFLGLANKRQLDYYINKCTKAGIKASKVIGGVEYFDVDVLLNIPTSKKPENVKHAPVQLCFLF